MSNNKTIQVHQYPYVCKAKKYSSGTIYLYDFYNRSERKTVTDQETIDDLYDDMQAAAEDLFAMQEDKEEYFERFNREYWIEYEDDVQAYEYQRNARQSAVDVYETYCMNAQSYSD